VLVGLALVLATWLLNSKPRRTQSCPPP